MISYMENKRILERIPVSIEVEYDHLEDIKGKIININDKGALVEQKITLPPGCCLDMHFKLPHSNNTIKAFGKVVWQEQNISTYGLMGIEFLEISKPIFN